MVARTQADADAQALLEAATRAADEAPLLLLLDERSPAHQGRGTAGVQRLRGAALLAMAQRGTLGRAALLAVLEELDTGRAAYPVAAAASALSAAPAAPEHALLLVGALRRLRDANDYVQLDRWGGDPTPSDEPPTAREIVLHALQRQGQAASAAGPALRAWWADDGHTLTAEEARVAEQLLDTWPDVPAPCCDTEGPLRSLARRCRRLVRTPALEDVRFEDQSGRHLGFDEVFVGQPGIVAFFYTRCDNPDKCSLTMARLAQVQRRLVEQGRSDAVRITGITYDPAFDDAARLAAYGKVRGFEPQQGHLLLRTTEGWQVLRDHFELGVGYLQGVVNRHRIEVHVHDAEGRIVLSHERLHWDADELLQNVLPLLERPDPGVPRAGAAASAVGGAARAAGPLLLLLLALFPKCPICGVAYLSLAGMAALPTLPGTYQWLPVLLAMLLAQLGLMGWMAWRGRNWPALLWSALGTGIAVIGGLGLQLDAALWSGLAIAGTGSLFTLVRSGQARRSALPS
jgi:protein SCO1